MLRTGGMAACCCCWALYRSMMASSSTAAMLVFPSTSKCFPVYSPQTTAASPSELPLTKPLEKHTLMMMTKNAAVLSEDSQRGIFSCLHLLHASPLNGSSWHAANQWKFISLSAYLFLLFATAAGKDAFDEVRLPPPAAKGGLQPGMHSAGSLVSSATSCAVLNGL